MPKYDKYHAKWKANMAKCSKYHAKCKMTMPNVANAMQNDRFYYQIVANTRQMVSGKKAKKNPKPEAKKQKPFYTPQISILGQDTCIFCIFSTFFNSTQRSIIKYVFFFKWFGFNWRNLAASTVPAGSASILGSSISEDPKGKCIEKMGL